jgi:hypothetical protein
MNTGFIWSQIRVGYPVLIWVVHPVYNPGRLLSVFICIESALIRAPLMNADTTRMNADDINYSLRLLFYIRVGSALIRGIIVLYPRLSMLDPR